MKIDSEKEVIDRKAIKKAEEANDSSVRYFVDGLLDKTKLIDYIENFILFQNQSIKIIAKNHQYLGVNNLMESVRNRKELNGKLGVFWHTQGSGKSYSMVMFARKVSDSKMPIDAKCAFLIELAEPLVEIVKAHTHFYSSLNPGERGTSLKMCVDALISKYGTDIFAMEITSKYDKFLQTIVNSRVRIMHIKRQQKGLFLNGPESVLYAQKMALLYRKILFEILDIDEDTYKENMQSLIDSLDKWNDIQEKFLAKLK